jgi:hypothetical protein
VSPCSTNSLFCCQTACTMKCWQPHSCEPYFFLNQVWALKTYRIVHMYRYCCLQYRTSALGVCGWEYSYIDSYLPRSGCPPRSKQTLLVHVYMIRRSSQRRHSERPLIIASSRDLQPLTVQIRGAVQYPYACTLHSSKVHSSSKHHVKKTSI